MSREPTPASGAQGVSPPPQGALSVDWAFVLQLREGTSFDAAALSGRVEHVSSGRASLFDSLEAARAFMEAVMRSGPGAAP